MALPSLLLLMVPLAIALSGKKKKPNGAAPVPAPNGKPIKLVGGGDFIAALPSNKGELREQMIAQGVAAGINDPIRMKYVSSIGAEGTPLQGWRLLVPVMSDALTIEGVRVNTNYDTADQIGAKLGLLMLTPFVDALSYAQADAQLTYTAPQPASSTTAAMVKTSAIVDKKLAPLLAKLEADEVPLVGNASKVWVITRRFLEAGAHPDSGVLRSEAAANHGLYRSAFDPIQNVGMFHGRKHVDSTQGLRYMGPESILVDPDGAESLIPTAFVLQDENLAPLISGERGKLRGKQIGEGALPFTRHPAIAPADVA